MSISVWYNAPSHPTSKILGQPIHVLGAHWPSWCNHINVLSSEQLVVESKLLQNDQGYRIIPWVGHKFDEAEVQRNMKHWPFTVSNISQKTSHIRGWNTYICGLTFSQSWQLVDFCVKTLEEVSALVLTKMKETAEVYLSKKVTHAVVTVLACMFCHFYKWFPPKSNT